MSTPKSPRTPTVGTAMMTHTINHRFITTFKMLPTVCDLCHKQMVIGESVLPTFSSVVVDDLVDM